MPDPIPTRLETERLRLLALGPEHADAFVAGGATLGRAIGASVPPTWPPELVADVVGFFAQQIREHPDWRGWWAWLIVQRAEGVLIGSAGFKGPPDQAGRVDIGYSVLDAWQGRGYATEAVAALVEWAWADARVTRIIGETFPQLAASIRVLEKSGFRFIGTGVGHEGQPDALQFERPAGASRREAGPGNLPAGGISH